MMARQAFVSGGSGGIGRSISLKLAEDGFDVIIGFNRNREAAYNVAREITSLGGCCYPIEIDVISRKSIQLAFKEISHVDVLVNNAGVSDKKSFLELSDDDWDNVLNVNLRGAFILSQKCLASMIEKQWGRIINISSIGGQWGGISQVHYAASKAGLIGLSMSLARLYSSQGITANSVSPGVIDTEMTSWIAGADREKLIEEIPAHRFGRCEEVASIVSFLSSEEAGYITGQTINVNGGMLRT